MAVQPIPIHADHLERIRRAKGVTGVSVAYWDGAQLHAAVAGLRNSVTGDPLTPDTLMHVGSITKVMNAALMMQLVDDGKIALDDPVARHLPELRLRDAQALARMTCAMLINHTNGINCDWLPEYGPDRERIVDSIARCAELGQLFTPGEFASYSNMGTVIAGYLTQKLREESWYGLVKKRLYEPLELHHALVDPLEVPRFRCSIGDVTDFRTGELSQTKRPFLAPSFAPAGSTQMMTAADLVMFARALLNAGVGVNGVRILSATSAARMVQPTAEFLFPIGWRIGLGWQISPTGILYHAGGGRGVFAELHAHAASGRALALLSNCDRGIALKPAIIDPILESWTGVPTPAPAPRQNAEIDVSRYDGVYENNLMRIRVFVRDGALAMHAAANGAQMASLYDVEPSLATALHPVGSDIFEQELTIPGWSDIRQEIRFVKPDAHGRMRFLAAGPRLLVRTR
jgi:CubicO group peptidase (beta-lactamase class C family)